MKIAVISDSHDHIDNLKKVLEAVADTDELIHCGDLVAPFIVKTMGEQYKKPVHIVWGNNDGDHELCQKRAQEVGNVTIHGDHGSIVVMGRRIAFNHYPEKAETRAKSGKYDLVCYGHTHEVDSHTVGNTLIVNPGDVMGMNDSKAHYAIYDTKTDKVEFKHIDVNPA